MISFDQVLLLEERVESAVKKIEQLNAENAALRAKVAELSNALNAKSEQFSSFQSDQSKIEEGILKALSRLSAVENVVLQASGAAQSLSSENTAQPAAQSQSEPVTNQVVASIQPENPAPAQNPEPTFDTMTVSEQSPEPVVTPDVAPDTIQNQGEASDSLTPDVDFEFGESDSSIAQPAGSNSNPVQPAEIPPQEPEAQQSSDSSQPMFDIF